MPGSSASIDELEKAFEADEDLLAKADAPRLYTSESVAGLLKLYFRLLPNPVFPRKLYNTFVTVSLTFGISRVDSYLLFNPAWLVSLNFPQIGQLKDQDRRIAELKETLSNYVPSAHVAVLQVLMPFLKEVAAESAVNKMSIDNLALVFGPTLLRPHARTVVWEALLLWRCYG